MLGGEFEIVFEGIERIVSPNDSFECESDDAFEFKSFNSVSQLQEEDDMDRLEKQYATCVDILQFANLAAASNPEKFFTDLFKLKLKS